MTTVTGHGPHAPHPAPPHHPPQAHGHGAAQGHAHPHASPHPHHAAHAKKRKSGHGLLYAMLAAAVLAGLALWHVLGGGARLSPEEELAKQMVDAAQGLSVPAVHSFSGPLKVSRGDKGLTVSAENLPSKACVSVAWRLAREGVVSINGVTPMRISAGRLSELCADDGATVSWMPREQPQ